MGFFTKPKPAEPTKVLENANKALADTFAIKKPVSATLTEIPEVEEDLPIYEEESTSQEGQGEEIEEEDDTYDAPETEEDAQIRELEQQAAQLKELKKAKAEEAKKKQEMPAEENTLVQAFAEIESRLQKIESVLFRSI